LGFPDTGINHRGHRDHRDRKRRNVLATDGAQMNPDGKRKNVKT
jgi:hypothetical protein